MYCTQYFKQKSLLCTYSCWVLEGYCHKHHAEGLPMLPLQCFTYSGRTKTYDNLKSNIDCFLLMHNRTLFSLLLFSSLSIWLAQQNQTGLSKQIQSPSPWIWLLWQSPCGPHPFMYLQWVVNGFYVLPVLGNKICIVPSHACQLPFNFVHKRFTNVCMVDHISIQTAVWPTCPFLANIVQGNGASGSWGMSLVYGFF